MAEIQGEWKDKTAGGSLLWPTWRYNPQYLLKVSEDGPVTITLEQHNDNNLNHVGFYVMKAPPNGRRLLVARGNQVGKSGFFTHKYVAVNHALAAGTYTIIPCTLDPKKEGTFTLKVSSGTLTPLSQASEYYEVSVNGEWTGVSAGGCRNHRTFKNNPKFHLLVTGHCDIESEMETTTTTLFVLLSQTEKHDFNPLGFYVVKSEDTKVVRKVLSKNIVCQVAFESDNTTEVIETCTLAPGHYTIFPCTFDPGYEAHFTLTIFSDKRVKFVEDTN
jgi:hypothetical protein